MADYPGPNDFLGLLLGTGESNNYGRWSSPEFDAAIADAGAATDPAAILAAYERAEAVVQRDVPVIPVSLRRRLGAGPDRACSAPSRTASASCGWRAWRGRR